MRRVQLLLFITFLLCSWSISAQTPQNIKLEEVRQPLTLKQKVRRGFRPQAQTVEDFNAERFKQKAREILELARAGNDSPSTAPSTKMEKWQQQDFQQFYRQADASRTLADPTLAIHYDSNRVPVFIRVDKKSVSADSHPPGLVNHPEIAHQFLERHRVLLQIDDPRQEFRVSKIERDPLGKTHVRMVQYLRDYPIYGSEVILHLDGAEVEVFNGRYFPTPIWAFDNVVLTEQDARRVIDQDLGPSANAHEHHRQAFGLLPGHEEEANLLIFPTGTPDDFALAWQITVAADAMNHWRYYIDAQTGEILRKLNETCTLVPPTTATALDIDGNLRTIQTFRDGNTYLLADASKPMFDQAQTDANGRLQGALITFDANNSDQESTFRIFSSNNNEWNNRASVSAHYGAGLVYDYYQSTFNRNSLDNQGGNILSIVDFKVDDNAFWNGRYIAYGRGTGTIFQEKSFAASLDIIAHELTHGVITNSANLEYLFQSGALNESFADIFGVMVDRDDWKLAENMVNPDFFVGGAMRDLSDPHNGWGNNATGPGWQPKHMSEYQNLREDQNNGGVHVNSGIPNHAFYLFAEQVGKEVAEQVYYRALTVYLSRFSQFLDCRFAVIQSALDLYGNEVANAAGNSFDQVGIVGEEPDEVDDDLPSVVGTDFLLTIVRDQNGSQIMGDYSFESGEYNRISNILPVPRPSVEETGNVAVYVGANSKKVYLTSLSVKNPNTNTEVGLEDEWQKVAINRDATKIAVLKPDDPRLYFYDGNTQSFQIFDLYNPTTSQDNTPSGRPDFADVIEFDPTGEFVMYDAFNSLGQDQGYWDVGLIKVWDNATQSLGNGQIFKLFSNLPVGVDIGNPTFSKTSSLRIAFEIFNHNSEQTTFYTYNLETGESEAIWSNIYYSDLSLLAFPSFSADDRQIAFAGETDDRTKVVAIIPLGTDKMTPDGNASSIVYGEAPLWYTSGRRDYIKPFAKFEANPTRGNAPLVVSFVDQSNNRPLTWSWEFDGGIPATSNQQNPTVRFSNPGSYEVKLVVTNPAGSDAETKLDYIKVSGTTRCDPPGGLSASDATSSTVTLDWPDNNDATAYFVQIRPAGSNQWTIAGEVTTSGAAVSELTACTEYEFQVRSICGGVESAFSPITTFVTTGCGTSCAEPTGIRSVEPGYSHFIFFWDANEDVDDYSIRYREKNTTAWLDFAGWTGSNVALANLEPCTEFEWQIRSRCQSEFSEWSPVQEIATGGCSDPYCYSYGLAFSDWIESVALADQRQESGRNFGYGNLTDNVFEAERGSTYTATLTPGTSGDAKTIYWKIWVDLNQDTDFNDDGELLVAESGPNDSGTTFLLNIPATALTGRTRMRVSLSATENDSPCSTGASREVEDYTLEIRGGATAPEANFTADLTSGIAPLTVSFTDQSTNSPESWTWEFAGGNPGTSTDKSPIVVYETPGTYFVALSVANAAGNDTEIKSGFITVTEAAAPPVSDFTGTPTLGSAPLEVSFRDLSANAPTEWSWLFEGGTPTTSDEQNPTVIYSEPGTYFVALTTRNAAGVDTEIKSNYIEVTNMAVAPAADFTAGPTSGVAPLTVEFSDISANSPTEWNWLFEGGTPNTSDERNPSVTYTEPGTYSVAMTAANSAGSDAVVKSGFITVTAVAVAPEAEFSGSPSFGNAPLTVDFTDQSTNNPTSWDWVFEGGTPNNSTEPNPQVTFAEPGLYFVALTVENEAGADTEIKTSYINVTNGLQIAMPTANFSAEPLAGTVPLTVDFEDLSANQPSSWSWEFDGAEPSKSNEQHPTVTYHQEGKFHVVLTVANQIGNHTEVKFGLIEIGAPTSTEALESIATVKYYPNPSADGRVNFEITLDETRDITVEVFDLLGRRVRQLERRSDRLNEFISLPAGAYLTKITADEFVHQGKILVLGE